MLLLYTKNSFDFTNTLYLFTPCCRLTLTCLYLNRDARNAGLYVHAHAHVLKWCCKGAYQCRYTRGHLQEPLARVHTRSFPPESGTQRYRYKCSFLFKHHGSEWRNRQVITRIKGAVRKAGHDYFRYKIHIQMYMIVHAYIHLYVHACTGKVSTDIHTCIHAVL